jgi:hypothetical protein
MQTNNARVNSTAKGVKTDSAGQMEFPFVRDARPLVWHPHNQLDSETHRKIGRIIAAKNGWFVRGNSIVTIQNVPAGFEYSGDEGSKYKVTSCTTGLEELGALAARSSLEQYLVPTCLDKKRKPIRRSFPISFCHGLIRSVFLRKALSHINRVLTVPLPFRVSGSRQLIYPARGYDKRFGTYLVRSAPKIRSMPLEEALALIERIHKEFPFTSDQSRTHAIARLLTPIARGFLGWTTRVPLWYYCANRPRAGKDYLAAIPLIVMEGYAFEDLPIGKEPEETGKRIMAAARAGRRFMHFSNCQVYLQNEYLIQAITNPVISGRRLGSNEASSDLTVPNEMEFSISANIGLTYREDVEPRMRQIELAYFDEDPNGRRFNNKYLHNEIKKNREETISALNAIVVNWANKGFPKGKTPFSSYPEWAEIVGGMMIAANLGDPCLPFKSTYEVGGDLKLEAMGELFRLCHAAFGTHVWVEKEQIYKCVRKANAHGNEALHWFGDLWESSNQMKLGKALRAFKNRVLFGICLSVDESDSKSQRHRFRFH